MTRYRSIALSAGLLFSAVQAAGQNSAPVKIVWYRRHKLRAIYNGNCCEFGRRAELPCLDAGLYERDNGRPTCRR
jgi:hypothetical protein